eukprot:476472_1
MIINNLKKKQNLLKNNKYIKYKSYIIDNINKPNIKYNKLFNTFNNINNNNNNNNQVSLILNQNNINEYNINFNDIKKYKKKWENICNSIIVPKTDVIIDKIQEYANNIKTSNIDILCNKLGLKQLNLSNTHKISNNNKIYTWQ